MAQSVGQVALDIVVGKNEVTGANGVLSKLGSVAKTAGKAAAIGIGVASTALVAMGKSAISAYGEYEQLTGGVETLFKDMADEVITNASNAYKTAGMSANAYMQTVTSFSASLLQSLGGDTVKAAKQADMAITDMADNANKMGTSMEMIQNAYQGFAKQNYTMLDNLKLGYGGTKTEMERLLADAQAISGIEFDISSYADVVEAIHIIQTEMGITGTTALEASGTIQGSIAAMGASWQNLLTGLTDPTQNFDALVTNFVESVGTAAENLVPRLSNVLKGIVDLVTQLAPVIVAELPNMVSTILPPLLEGVISLVSAVIDTLPSMVQMIVQMLPTLIPMLINGLVDMTVSLCTNFATIIKPIVNELPNIITSITDALMSNLDVLIQGLVDLTVAIIPMLPTIMLALLDALPSVIQMVSNGLMDAMPILISGLIQMCILLMTELVNYWAQLPSRISAFLSSLFVNIYNVVTTWWANILSSASALLSPLTERVGDAFSRISDKISNAMTKAKEIVSNAIDKIKSFFNFEWSLPKLKMPHFSVSGSFSLSPLSVPSFGISWYKKAMNNGMILDSPTIFGMSKNGQLLGGGEAGSETVVGTNSLLDMIQSAVSSSFIRQPTVSAPTLTNVRAGTSAAESGSGKIDKIVELLLLLIEKNGDITLPIYIGNELIDEYILNKNSRQLLRSGGHA